MDQLCTVLINYNWFYLEHIQTRVPLNDDYLQKQCFTILTLKSVFKKYHFLITRR